MTFESDEEKTARLRSVEQEIHNLTISVLTKIKNHKATCKDPTCHLKLALEG